MNNLDMFALQPGKRLLSLYNERTGQSLNSYDFFNREFFPLFYDHEKYLQWSVNSPFVQGYRSVSPPNKSDRKKKLETLHEKISTLEPDASFAIGFPAAELSATTSGQVTNLKIPIKSEDIYASWIGSGLGIGVQGGLVLFIENDKILWSLYEGWKVYRRCLLETPKLKPNQIDTWNGQWITHVFGFDFNSEVPLEGFYAFETKKDGVVQISTQTWIKVLFALARQFPNEKMVSYVCSSGQTNTTVGFVQLNLPEVYSLFEIYEALFGKQSSLNSTEVLERLYATEFTFFRACQFGAIGLRAIEPKNLHDFMPSRLGSYRIPKPTQKEEIKITYNIYLTWIIAMLNDKELLSKAEEFAKVLQQYISGDRKARTKRQRNVENVLEAGNRRIFIDRLTGIVKDAPAVGDTFNQTVISIMNMPPDNFLLFLTLIRFKYSLIK